MDIEQEIGKALADPEIMNKIGSILSQLGANGASAAAEDKTHQNSSDVSGNNVLSALSANINDDRTRLLLAIKPFLSEKRAPYMDSALTIMKLVSMGKIGKDLKLF